MPSVTHVTYNQGLPSKHLHLGNLVHDFQNPDILEPYIEKAYTDIAEPPPAWAESRALENFALTLGEDDEADDSEEEEGPRYRVVAAAKSVKLDIKDSGKFFNEVTLKSEDARKWLASHLSAAEDLQPKPKPQIWMLTGLILMTHATWSKLSSKQKFTPGLPAPFDPTGVTAIRRSSVSEHVKPVFGYEEKEDNKHVPGGAVIHETGKYPGTRGWAAQWELVDVKILPADKAKGGNNQLPLHVPGQGAKVAVVELDEGEYAKNGDEGAIDDEEYWEKFLDVVEEYE
ncbi:hypothetical protein L207DRAFT_538810 [Hyaloscypha variabilis F]|uniref:Uncharacterized protein n=1 Tax=Hyaloscypha variabilis (strain UAMH 11265 / GT02V1 / F) TaxID=1149755 RepID=A0A2J6QT11_HYAVF|nr:hypothetical protein L207DRAFT_538810 [Hyaloscypha variabilis F]